MNDLNRIVEQQRALVFARSNLYFLTAMLLVVGIGDILISGSWFYFALTALALVSFLAYLGLLGRLPLVPATLGLFCILELLVAAAVYNAGGVMTGAATLFSALILGIGLVLTERRSILIITFISILVYLILSLLQFTNVLVPPQPGPLLNEQSTGYKLFSTVLQTALIGLVGAVTGSVASSMQQRAQALEQARSQANEHAKAAEQLATQLNEKVEALRVTEETLRRTVDILSVPALPLVEGALAMPLIGYIDEERAGRLTSFLLKAIYERRARLALIDLTAIEATDALPAMLARMARGARLLGAELVVAGLQPAVARLLISEVGDRLAIQTFQTLEQAIDYALSQRALA